MVSRSSFYTYYLGGEFLVLFIGVPLVFYFNLVPVPKIAALLAVTLGIVVLMWFDASYTFTKLLRNPAGSDGFRGMARRVLLVALALFTLVQAIHPESLFSFPLQDPYTWAVVMLLYPFLSALPQELMYREFFFYRYEAIFGTGWLRILASAASFSFLHIIYDNYWALILSFLGGLILARVYHKTHSLWWVSLEHALYGCLVFTIGLGMYFYEVF